MVTTVALADRNSKISGHSTIEIYENLTCFNLVNTDNDREHIMASDHRAQKTVDLFPVLCFKSHPASCDMKEWHVELLAALCILHLYVKLCSWTVQ